MPTYDYECEACNHRFEHFQSMSSNKLRTCPECKKRKLIRLVGAGAGVIFKGSGFYETDYKRTGSDSSASKSDSSKKETSESSASTAESGSSKSSDSSSGTGGDSGSTSSSSGDSKSSDSSAEK